MEGKMLRVILTLAATKTVNGIIGYDCKKANTKIASFSTTKIGSCVTPQIVTREENITVTEIIHMKKYMLTEVLQCNLEISEKNFYCGALGHLGLIDKYPFNPTIVINAEIRKINRESLYVVGSGDATGACTWGNYMKEGKLFKDTAVYH